MKYGDEEELNNRVVTLLSGGHRNTACSLILERYGPSLRGHLRGLIGAPEVADDRYQDLCISLLLYLSRFHEEISLRCWLFRKAHDLYVDWCRRPSRRIFIRLDSGVAANLRAPSQTSGDQQDERARMLQRTYDLLNDDERELLVLRTERAFSFREIADTLRIEEAAARQRFQRIKSLLRDELVRA